MCVCTQILVKYSTCKFIAFKKEVNSFKSGILIIANIISCHWLNQAVKKHQAQELWALVPSDIVDHSYQGFTNLAVPQNHQEFIQKVLIPRKKDKETRHDEGKKGSMEDRSWGLTKRFQKDKKEWGKKNIRKRKKKITEVKFPEFKKVFSLHTVMDHLVSGNKIKRSSFCF